MRVSGHATRSMLDRYSIGTEDATRAALQRQTVYLADLRARGRRKMIPAPPTTGELDDTDTPTDTPAL